MVQLLRDLPAPDYSQPENTYWAIGAPQEEVEHFRNTHINYAPNPVTADREIALAEREERGLLIYEHCTIAELKGFIKARHLQMPKGRAHKAEFIAVLEAADEEPVFDKFRSLPAELRNAVYKEYVDDLPRLPVLPHQPPLTLASSQIRKESLPIYYDRAVFAFRIWTNAGLREVRHGMYEKNTSLDETPPKLARITSDENFKRIRNFHFALITDRRGRRGQYFHRVVAEWKVDLNKVDEDGSQSSDLYKTSLYGNYWPAALPYVDGAVMNVVMGIQQRRKNVHKLRKSDFEDFSNAMLRALNAVQA